MKFRIKHADTIAGIFILVAIIALALFLIFIGLNQRWFAKDYFFTSRFNSGNGLSPGMAIKLKGFQIGTVDKLSLLDDNTVEIIFHIYDTYYERVHRNSLLELVTSPIGLGGGLLFHPGKHKGVPLPEDSFIPSLDFPEGKKLVEQRLVEIPKGDDTINNIINSIGPVLTNTNEAIISAKNVLEDLKLAMKGKDIGPVGKILTNTKNLTSDISDITKNINPQIDAILNDISEVSLHINELFANTDGLITRLLDPKGSFATLLDDDNVLFDKIENILVEINGIIEGLNDFTSYLNDSTPQISGLLEDGREALDKGKDVLEGLKNNPILKGGITEQKTQPATFQSYRDEDF